MMMMQCFVLISCFAFLTYGEANKRNCTIRGVKVADDNKVHFLKNEWYKCRNGRGIAHCSFRTNHPKKMIEANSNDYIDIKSGRYGCRAGKDLIGHRFLIVARTWPYCTHLGVRVPADHKLHYVQDKLFKCRNGQVIAFCFLRRENKVLEANNNEYFTNINGINGCTAGKDLVARLYIITETTTTPRTSTVTHAPLSRTDCVLFDGTGLKLWESADVRVSENLGRRYRCTKRGPKQTRCVYFESQTSDSFVKYVRLGQQNEITLHEGKRLGDGAKLRMAKVTCARSGVPQLDSFV